MVYRYLFIDVLVRVILLTVTSFVLAFEYVLVNDIIINLNLLVLIILQVLLFIRSSNRVNRDLQAFFSSVRNEDSTLLLTKKFRNKSYLKLHQSLYDVNEMIREIRMEIVLHNQYFKAITEHIDVGLITFTKKGEVRLLNRAAQNLLNLKGAITIDSLDRIRKGLSTILSSIKPFEHKLVNLKTSGIRGQELKQLSIRATELKFRDENIKIVSLQDIKNELDIKELEAWQNLIRVLTHEMMNSTGPIKSTTHTLIDLIAANSDAEVQQKNREPELVADLLKGLKIIEERSRGLELFVKHFRQFSLLPKPEFKIVRLNEVFRDLKVLMDEDIRSNGVDFKTSTVPENLSVEADKKLLVQLLINLLKNSIFSLRKTENPTLEISAYSGADGRTEISVTDNGPGILPDEMEKIFIPFYTTRNDGSGIGLSLARQIMRIHNGTIDAWSEPGIQTVFKLKF
ncbi:MAG: hypothetical protein JSV24_06980 [Bacteroidales bacterium]|nr:MAG: hypothetical protein JSV24_06980 [Bacteroidales bacterium]